MTIILPAALSIVGMAGLIVADPAGKAILAIFISFILSFRNRSLRPFVKLILLVAFFCIPMFLIHSLLNVQFPKDKEFLGLAIRSDGILFAYAITSRIAIFVAIALSWYQLQSDYIIDAFARLRFPVLFIAITAQGISIINQIPRHVQGILLAQQSRGIKTGPGVLARLKALPTVVLPLISKLLIDTEARSVALVSRGFASFPMSTPTVRLTSPLDLFLGVLSCVGGAVIGILFHG